jgi:hypothetical protein
MENFTGTLTKRRHGTARPTRGGTPSSYERRLRPRCTRDVATGRTPLDLSGEDIRRRMYDDRTDGDEFCLRPDLTDLVSRHHLASSIAGQPAITHSVQFVID